MTILKLGAGAIRGEQLGGVLRFRGIPYAAPPVGERRWRPPTPAEPWSGVREATEPGHPAPQLAQSFAEVTALEEDCLTLDVTVPATERTGRPVLIWLHGGGGTNGSTAGYDARRLATAGDLIVVTPTFRLGVLACFGHPALPDGGTFGLQDQQAVLRWVREEIAHFGGDPGNVTLGGDSYGALMVAAHLVAPGSAGLFHRAVLQSSFTALGPTPAHTFFPGAPALPPRWSPLAELAQLGRDTATQHGWTTPGVDPDAALAQLRQVPVADLLPASPAFIRPAFGGPVLPESPATALPAGRFHRVPVLLGTTRDEARFFVSLLAAPLTAEDFPRLLTEAFGEAAPQIARRYPLSGFATPSLAWAQLSTDRAWARPTWELATALAAHTPTWCYEFADRDAPQLIPVPGFPTGAQHASDLPYHFDAPFAPELSPAQRALAERMNRHWAAFASTGDPGWPRFEHVQRLAPGEIGGADYRAEHQLDFWAEMPVGSRGS